MGPIALTVYSLYGVQGLPFPIPHTHHDRLTLSFVPYQVRLTVDGTELLSSPMKGGDFFGVICLAGLSDVRPYTTTAMRQCQLCTLSRDDMEMLVGMHPEMGDLLMEFARARLAEIQADLAASKSFANRTNGDTDTGTELASMTQIESAETSKANHVAREQKKSAQEVFQRIHLARFVATKQTAAKKRWGKIMSGGRMFAAVADGVEAAGESSEGPTMDDLLGTPGDGDGEYKFSKTLSALKVRVARFPNPASTFSHTRR
jgi:hypothetical protein